MKELWKDPLPVEDSFKLLIAFRQRNLGKPDSSHPRTILDFDFDQQKISLRLLAVVSGRSTVLYLRGTGMKRLNPMTLVSPVAAQMSPADHGHPTEQCPPIIQTASIVLCLLFATALNVVTPVLADPTDWAPALRMQLKAEKACQFLYMINVKEYRFLNRDVIEARVYCDDGRMFDVTRRSPDRLFVIEECSLNTC